MKKVPSPECAGAAGRKIVGAQQGKCLLNWKARNTDPDTKHPRRKEVFTCVVTIKDYLYCERGEESCIFPTQHHYATRGPAALLRGNTTTIIYILTKK